MALEIFQEKEAYTSVGYSTALACWHGYVSPIPACRQRGMPGGLKRANRGVCSRRGICKARYRYHLLLHIIHTQVLSNIAFTPRPLWVSPFSVDLPSFPFPSLSSFPSIHSTLHISRALFCCSVACLTLKVSPAADSKTEKKVSSSQTTLNNITSQHTPQNVIGDVPDGWRPALQLPRYPTTCPQ